MSYRSELFDRFYNAITTHYRESREIAFYANLLCLSPKYFATVIKQATDISASEWINRYVIIEAKWILSNKHQMTVQQISHYLGFSTPTSFSRYFKANAGLSPKAYRDQVKR